MLSTPVITSIIKSTIFDATGKSVVDTKVNLLDSEIGIHPADFLFIFDQLEERLQLPVYSIFTCQSYDVMTIENLASAFSLLYQGK